MLNARLSSTCGHNLEKFKFVTTVVGRCHHQCHSKQQHQNKAASLRAGGELWPEKPTKCEFMFCGGFRSKQKRNVFCGKTFYYFRLKSKFQWYDDHCHRIVLGRSQFNCLNLLLCLSPWIFLLMLSLIDGTRKRCWWRQLGIIHEQNWCFAWNLVKFNLFLPSAGDPRWKSVKMNWVGWHQFLITHSCKLDPPARFVFPRMRIQLRNDR